MASPDKSLAQGHNVYEADIPVVAPGVELISGPATIWDVTVTSDLNQVSIVNFSDSTTAYDSTKRQGKVVINGQTTVHLTFPTGRHCSEGLCAIANNGSVDVRISYD